MSRYEIGDVFRKHSVPYRQKYKLSLQQAKVLHAVSVCRTWYMQGHTNQCNVCGHTESAYNSCSNRHCPKCQNLNKLKWIEKIQTELLPIRYFHVVFTMPSHLNRLALINQKVVYDLLFKASSETIKQLAASHKKLGITTGILSILHTWGQNLMDHPHVHMLVPAGGLDIKTGKWKNTSEKFFLYVKSVSKVFRAKFLIYLKEAFKEDRLKFAGSIIELKHKKAFMEFVDQLFAMAWVVYVKKTFKSNMQIIRYLGNYTHRIAISDSRLVSVEDNSVSFTWKDYRDKNKRKIMTLTPEEFIRRFLLHVLPKGFFKIRYYGIFASRNRPTQLALCKKQLGIKMQKNIAKVKVSWQDLLLRLTGVDVTLCKVCKKGRMEYYGLTYQKLYPG